MEMVVPTKAKRANVARSLRERWNLANSRSIVEKFAECEAGAFGQM